MQDNYKITISPETIRGDLGSVQYSGYSVGIYSGMSAVLTGGTNGNSSLTGLTIPILLRETINDMGYYTPFDGAIYQKDVVTNFLFSSTTSNPYTYQIFNTSNEFQKFLDLSSFIVDWGDGSQVQQITAFTPNYISHTYPTNSTPKQYQITLEQTNPWGLTKVVKTVTTPYIIQQNYNPNGTAYFTSNYGNWSGTPVSYDFIFSGDAVNVVSAQTSNNYVSVPFTISGICNSKLTELQFYGSPQYRVGVPVIKEQQIYGVVNSIATNYTGYTILDVDYYDYSDGSTLYFVKSSGFTEDNITAEPITKQELLINVVDQPQIQSNVYIERGKNSAYERVQRLGEIDNLGDLIEYGYGFFGVEKKG